MYVVPQSRKIPSGVSYQCTITPDDKLMEGRLGGNGV